MNFNQDLFLTFFEKMYLIRRFEQKVYEFAERGLVFGSTHLEVGEEATAVGTLLNINKEDYLIATHRGHGQELLKGTDVKNMMAEMIGKDAGVCGGRVGSMHVADASVNNLGAQGIIGASFPISVGVGLALNLLGDKEKILISFFGDGASNQGNFYESLNMADLWSVPVFFVCVNNQYGMGTAYCSTCNIEIHKKASLFNIKSDYEDGNDVEKVYHKSKELIDYVRTKRLPALLELKTYRTIGHSAFDKHPYRTKEEIEDWKKKDPIKRIEATLTSNGVPLDTIDDIKKKVEAQIQDAADFAIKSEYPAYTDALEQ